MEAKGLEFPTFESFKVWFDQSTKDYPFKTGKYRGRFYRDFSEGKVPIEVLKEIAKQTYIFIQSSNGNVTWALVNHADLWRKHPELYDIVAAKVGSELSQPAPGGHGRVYLKYGRYLGLKDEDLFGAKPLPELEAQGNSHLNYRSQRPPQTAVRWMLEGLVGYRMKYYRDVLHDKYGLPDDILEYFDMHVVADLEEHGPEGEMILKRLYELGLVTEEDYEPMRMEVEGYDRRASGNPDISWQDVLYLQYCSASCQEINEVFNAR